MSYSYADPFVSRRDNFEECEYWIRDINANPNELIHETKKPSGVFSAKISNPENSSPSVIGGVFMFDSINLMLETYDDIKELKVNDIVRFNGNIYMVTGIQRQPYRKNTQFNNDLRFKTFISLRG